MIRKTDKNDLTVVISKLKELEAFNAYIDNYSRTTPTTSLEFVTRNEVEQLLVKNLRCVGKLSKRLNFRPLIDLNERIERHYFNPWFWKTLSHELKHLSKYMSIANKALANLK